MDDRPTSRLSEAIRSRSADRLQEPCLVDGSREMTYAAFWADVDGAMRELARVLPARRMVVLVTVDSFVPFLVALFALWQLGHAAIPVRAGEAAELSKLFVQHGYLSHAQRRSGPYHRVVAGAFDMHNAGDDALWIGSSGHDGSSKLCRLSVAGTLRNIAANAESLSLVPGSRTLVTLPVYYSYALIGQVLSHLWVGGCIVYAGGPLATLRCLQTVGTGDVDSLFLVPSVARTLTHMCRQRGMDTVDKTVRLVTIGGAAFDAVAYRQLSRVFPAAKLAITYGLAEAGPRVSTSICPTAAEVQRGVVGAPIPGVGVSTARPDYRTTGTLPAPIRINSPAVMLGYAFNGSSTEAEPGVSLLTGDLGHIEHGVLYLDGRQGETINHSNGTLTIMQLCRHLLMRNQLASLEGGVFGPPQHQTLKLFVMPLPGTKVQMEALKRQAVALTEIPGERISVSLRLNSPNSRLLK